MIPNTLRSALRLLTNSRFIQIPRCKITIITQFHQVFGRKYPCSPAPPKKRGKELESAAVWTGYTIATTNFFNHEQHSWILARQT